MVFIRDILITARLKDKKKIGGWEIQILFELWKIYW